MAELTPEQLRLIRESAMGRARDREEQRKAEEKNISQWRATQPETPSSIVDLGMPSTITADIATARSTAIARGQDWARQRQESNLNVLYQRHANAPYYESHETYADYQKSYAQYERSMAGYQEAQAKVSRDVSFTNQENLQRIQAQRVRQWDNIEADLQRREVQPSALASLKQNYYYLMGENLSDDELNSRWQEQLDMYGLGYESYYRGLRDVGVSEQEVSNLSQMEDTPAWSTEATRISKTYDEYFNPPTEAPLSLKIARHSKTLDTPLSAITQLGAGVLGTVESAGMALGSIFNPDISRRYEAPTGFWEFLGGEASFEEYPLAGIGSLLGLPFEMVAWKGVGRAVGSAVGVPLGYALKSSKVSSGLGFLERQIMAHPKAIGLGVAGWFGGSVALGAKSKMDIGLSPERVLAEASRDVFRGVALGIGLSKGVQSGVGFIRTRGKTKIPLEELTSPEVISGAERFPLYKSARTPKSMLDEFKLSSKTYASEDYFGLVPKGKYRVYHTTPSEFGPTTTTKAGTSEVEGLFTSSPLSPHFLKVGGEKFDWFGVPTLRPTANVLDTHILGLPSSLRSASGKSISGFLATKSGRDVAYLVPKSEIQAIIPKDTLLSKTAFPSGKEFYSSWQGVRFPLMMYSVSGQGTTSLESLIGLGSLKSYRVSPYSAFGFALSPPPAKGKGVKAPSDYSIISYLSSFGFGASYPRGGRRTKSASSSRLLDELISPVSSSRITSSFIPPTSITSTTSSYIPFPDVFPPIPPPRRGRSSAFPPLIYRGATSDEEEGLPRLGRKKRRRGSPGMRLPYLTMGLDVLWGGQFPARARHVEKTLGLGKGSLKHISNVMGDYFIPRGFKKAQRQKQLSRDYFLGLLPAKSRRRKR